MVTYDEIMTTLEEQHVATLVRNCLPGSVAEAKEAIKKHPSLELEVVKTKDAGVCIAIRPKDFESKADDVTPIGVRLKGHTAVAGFFKKNRSKNGK